MLTSLGHRAVSSSYYEDGTVHLGSTRYHVLYVVGVTWAVNVRVVAVFRFVFYVCGVDRDTTLFLLGSRIDVIVIFLLCKTLVCEYVSDRRSEGGLTVVNVTDSTDIQVRFISFEGFLSHRLEI